MSTLTTISKAVAYDDAAQVSNPSNVPVNWARTIQNLEVANPSTEMFTLGALETRTLIDGQRTTSIDGTTAFALSSSPLDPSRYRLAATGGTLPVFRTARTLVAGGGGLVLTLTLNSNLSMTVTSGATPAFGAVQVGDVVFIRGTKTGDSATLFNSLNAGYWSVLTASAAAITMSRATNEVFEGAAQVVTPADGVNDFQVFSVAGVQVGDLVELGPAFAVSAQKSSSVVAVNPKWVEFISTAALGAETGILPGVTGLLFYTQAKRFLQVEADQECVLRINGDLGNTNRLSPWIAGAKGFGAEFRKVGPSWKLVVVNRAQTPLKLTLIAAE